MKYRLILASASPRRRELLEQVGMEFEIFPANGEEVITSTKPEEVVLELSRHKALEVTEHFKKEAEKSETIVILGADTVVALEGQILGKPKDESDAVRMLKMLSGKEHSVFTGVTLVILEDGKQKEHSFYEETKVLMYPMSQSQIESYVKTKEPMDKAGAYAIQGKCAVYIERIAGDYNNVVGLPVARIFHKLEKVIENNH